MILKEIIVLCFLLCLLISFFSKKHKKRNLGSAAALNR
jgi:hypothetical protein